ncbi:MAG TPA: NB-ARC domain-containing protein [Ktedonobacteraceae bacterium]|nr:NB-ARC domain-containing protein [Ktedonobacteraceae bacterium]
MRDERLRRHWSQQELADLVGATLNTVSRWERGLTDCSPYFRNKLCEVFGKAAHELWLVPDDEIEAPQLALCDPLLPSPRRLVGREKLQHQLKEQLCTTWEARIFALTGLPGVGKSALAVALAHDSMIQEHFSAGILFANLGLEPEIPHIFDRWGALLGVANEKAHPNTDGDWLVQLRSAIGLRRMLIVIDNVWHLEDALPLLQIGGAYCTFLLTTRFVNIASGLAGECSLIVPELSEDEGLHLFSQLAPIAVKAEAQSVRKLVQAVGGLPLALLLMGQYLRVQSHTQQPRRLSLALERLHDAEERLQLKQPLLSPDQSMVSLQAEIALSDRCLDSQAQQALRRLSVFLARPNTFSEQAALFVAGISAEVLDSLSDAKLLESPGPERYSLHPCIADYAAFHNDQEIAARRMVEYFTDFVEAHQKKAELLEAESLNIFTALKLAYKHHMLIPQIRIMIAIFDFVEVRGFANLTEEYLLSTRNSLRTDEDASSLLSLLFHLSKLGWIQDAHRFLVMHPRQRLDLHFQNVFLENPFQTTKASTCRMLPSLGVNVETAEASLSTILQRLESPALFKQLTTLQTRPHSNDAQSLNHSLQYGLTLARRRENTTQTCVILANLAALARQQKNFLEAEHLLEEGFSIVNEHEDMRGFSLLLMEKVHLAFAARKSEEARTAFKKILELFPQEKLLTIARYYGLARVAVTIR